MLALTILLVVSVDGGLHIVVAGIGVDGGANGITGIAVGVGINIFTGSAGTDVDDGDVNMVTGIGGRDDVRTNATVGFGTSTITAIGGAGLDDGSADTMTAIGDVGGDMANTITGGVGPDIITGGSVGGGIAKMITDGGAPHS